MRETVRTSELAAALGLTKKSVLEKARSQGWAYVTRGNAMCWVENRLPSDVRFAVALLRSGKGAPAPVQETGGGPQGNAFLNAGSGQQEKAQYRASLIYEYKKSGMNVADFITCYNGGEISRTLLSALGDVSVPTFYRWLKGFKEMGADGLVPRQGRNRGGAGESLTEEEKNLLKRFWLVNTQPSARHAWLLMKANIPYSRCSHQTALRYLESIPQMIAGYWRRGAGRFENLFLPHMEQDIGRYRSLEVVVSDHHCLDCVVRYRGQLVRPWMTTFQDLRSGKVVGWCPTVKPSSVSIVIAYYMCCIRYGIPAGVLFDNGKDYHSKWLTGHTENVRVLTPEGFGEEKEVEFQGLFQIVGSDVRFTRTYNGKSKARQERYFRIIGEYLAKDMGSYVGSDSRTRPDDAQLMWRAIDGREKRDDIPEWEDFVSRAGAMVEWLNDNLPCESKYMEGKTRSEVFEENLPPPEQIRKADKEVLQKALLKGQVRKVSRNGIKVNGTWYWSEALAPYFGTQVRSYEDLTHDDRLVCHTLDGRYICTAAANYWKETGELDCDMERLGHARKTLTQWAEQGSSQVEVAPEFETMTDVALAAYRAKGTPLEVVQVDRFLDYSGEAGKMAAGAEGRTPVKPGRSALRSPLDADSEEYMEEEA